MPYPYWRCILVLDRFFDWMMWSGIILHPLIWLCLLKKVYWGRKCGNRWRQPTLSEISWWIFGLKTYLYLSSWPIQLTVIFLFSPALCRKFQCHSWEYRAGSTEILMYFPKEILWCNASFSFPCWNTSLTSRTDPWQWGLSLRICSHWTKSSLFSWSWAMWTSDPRNWDEDAADGKGWFTFPVLQLQIFDELLVGWNVKGSFPVWEQSWSLPGCEVFVVFCSFLKWTLFSSSKSMELLSNWLVQIALDADFWEVLHTHSPA